jgi:hypothetical protein
VNASIGTKHSPQRIEMSINQEALPIAVFLGNEREAWILRILKLAIKLDDF